MHGRARAAVDRGGLEVELALRREEPAQLPVVEGGEGPRQPVARVCVRRVDHEVGEGLPDRALEAESLEPFSGRSARGCLALPDLVAVQHQNAGAAAA